MKSVVSTNRARLSTVVRWQFQVVGTNPCASLYVTRQRAAEALAAQYDAHQRAAKAATS
ncbi:hypothetical protein Mx4_p10 [Myxococcus phage Mx4]|nr:hypothetical protein Mx4_p10 [Myxococcus phage Mx4]